MVGSEDNAIHRRDEFRKWLGEKKKEFAKEEEILKMPSNAKLGEPKMGRLHSLKAFWIPWQEDRINSTVEVVEGVRHGSGAVLAVVQSFLRQHVRAGQR